MKGIWFAVLLALGLFYYASYAGADEGAYKNLVGMAQAAATDRGPDADDTAGRAPAAADELKDSLADIPAPRAASVPKPFAAAVPAAAPAAPVVAVPPSSKPRLWTRLYSTLLPSWRRPPSLQDAFAPRVSTSSFRSPMPPLRALMPPPDSESVAAGERRGLAELMSVSAPTGGK